MMRTRSIGRNPTRRYPGCVSARWSGVATTAEPKQAGCATCRAEDKSYNSTLEPTLWRPEGPVASMRIRQARARRSMVGNHADRLRPLLDRQPKPDRATQRPHWARGRGRADLRRSRHPEGSGRQAVRVLRREPNPPLAGQNMSNCHIYVTGLWFDHPRRPDLRYLTAGIRHQHSAESIVRPWPAYFPAPGCLAAPPSDPSRMLWSAHRSLPDGRSPRPRCASTQMLDSVPSRSPR